jgi:hypothetical protein
MNPPRHERGGGGSLFRKLAQGNRGPKNEIARPGWYYALSIDLEKTLTPIFLAGWKLAGRAVRQSAATM